MLVRNEPSPGEIRERALYAEMGLKHEEYERIVASLGREPNFTETGIFSVMWSEHCSYKHSKPYLKQFPTSGERVLQGPGEGAGVVDIGDGYAVVFKMESHNHPSAVEPVQGAATGVGGILRDVFSMGARPVALLNALRFGNLTSPRVPFLVKGVVEGISGYGNCVGVPTVGGDVQFDDSYEGNPLVNAMCVGLIKHEDLQKGVASGAGNVVIYAGAKTGKDGIHGATFASTELTDESAEDRPAVQVGDPFSEKQLMEACLEAIYLDGLVGIQDMGAAGLTSSSSEMASKAGMGLRLDLDQIPVREEDTTPYEMMLSESQERMLLVVEKGKEAAFLDVFARYGLEAVVCGEVIEEQVLELSHRGEIVASLPVDALVEDAPVYYVPAVAPEKVAEPAWHPGDVSIEETLKGLLQQPTIASKEWIYRQYDHQVQSNTVTPPGSDSSVVRVRGTNKGLSFTTDCNARYMKLDPYEGGKYVVAEAARNLTASGALPLALTDCLNYGNPEKGEIAWQLQESVRGMAEACLALETPVVSGNVSLYNETKSKAIAPTPMVGMVGLLELDGQPITQYAVASDERLYLVGAQAGSFAGSELQYKQEGRVFGELPPLSLDVEVARQQAVRKAIKAGLLSSCHDVAEGGVAVAVAEMLFREPGIGATLYLQTTDAIVELFAEAPSRFVCTVPQEKEAAFLAAVPDAVAIGKTTDTDLFEVKQGDRLLCSVGREELESLWRGALACYLN